MTRESAGAQVTFRMTFTADEVVCLRSAAAAHYDAACREFGPLRMLAAYADLGGLPLDLSLGWREFDILAKICESPLVPPVVSQAVFAAFAALREATKVADAALAAAWFHIG